MSDDNEEVVLARINVEDEHECFVEGRDGQIVRLASVRHDMDVGFRETPAGFEADADDDDDDDGEASFDQAVSDGSYDEQILQDYGDGASIEDIAQHYGPRGRRIVEAKIKQLNEDAEGWI